MITKKPRKRVPLEKKTSQELVKEADKWFSKYIRLRDSVYSGSAWVSSCITCNRGLVVIDESGKWVASSQNGHMISRGVHKLRYSEYNCNIQCAHCNVWLDKDEMIERYRKALDLKYGDGCYDDLKSQSKEDGAYKHHTKTELLEIIHDAKAFVNHCLNNQEKYMPGTANVR